jgi:hypothetical protein
MATTVEVTNENEVTVTVGGDNAVVNAHVIDETNPHSVTKAQIGLSDLTNDTQIPLSQRGAANGVASLDANGLVPSAQIPPLALGEVHSVADNVARDALTVQEGDIAVTADSGNMYIYDGSSWLQITTTADVLSVNGQTGTVSLDMGDFAETATEKIMTADERTKLAAVEDSADANPATVSQAEAEAGTVTETRLWTPERIAQAIAALAGGGGADPYWQATVGTTGADYTTVLAAITAGHTRILMIDDTTDSAAITLPDGLHLCGLTGNEIWTKSATVNWSMTADHTYTIQNLEINQTANWWVFTSAAAKLVIRDVVFDNDATSSGRSLMNANGSSVSLHIDNFTVKGSNKETFVYSPDGSTGVGSINGFHFIGEGSSASIILSGDGQNANNITITGTVSTGGDTDFGGNISNVKSTATGVGFRFDDGQFTNFRLGGTGNITYAGAKILIENFEARSYTLTGAQADVKVSNSIFGTLSIGGEHAAVSSVQVESSMTCGSEDGVYSSVVVDGSVTVSSSEAVIMGMKIKGNLTVNSGANNNSIYAMVDGTTTDNGTSNTIVAL